MEYVREQIKLLGQPHPKVYLLGKDFVEMLDVDAMRKREPDVHLGATFQALRRRNNIERCFLVFGAQGFDPQGREHTWAVLFEERDVIDGRRWWMAMLEYRTDPASGLGIPDPKWSPSAGETDNPAQLPPFVHEIAAPPPGSQQAEILDASDTWQPDIKFTFGEVPEGKPIPTNAKQMVEFAAALAVNDLLTGKLTGTLVVRIVGRSWELWVLGDDMPASVHEMIRWIANHRLPAAEGVALAQLAVLPHDEPPVPGMQIVGEYGEMLVETWAPVVFPEGPGGPRTVPVVHWRSPRPVSPEGRWLGVPSKAELIEPGFD